MYSRGRPWISVPLASTSQGWDDRPGPASLAWDFIWDRLSSFWVNLKYVILFSEWRACCVCRDKPSLVAWLLKQLWNLQIVLIIVSNARHPLQNHGVDLRKIVPTLRGEFLWPYCMCMCVPSLHANKQAHAPGRGVFLPWASGSRVPTLQDYLLQFYSPYSTATLTVNM